MSRPAAGLTNYAKSTGTTLVNWDTATVAALSDSASMTSTEESAQPSPNQPITGLGVRLTTADASEHFTTLSSIGPFDWSDNPAIEVDIYCPAGWDSGSNPIKLQFGSGGTVSANYEIRHSRLSADKDDMQGWYRISVNVQDMYSTTPGSVDLAAINVCRIRVDPATALSSGSYVIVGPIRQSASCRSMFLITNDDGNVETYNNLSEFTSRSLPVTAYINSSTIGTGTRMTEANLQSLYAAGWTIGNHFEDHNGWGPSDGTPLTQAQKLAQYEATRDWIEARYPGGGVHCSYPFGHYTYTDQMLLKTAGAKTARTTIAQLKQGAVDPVASLNSAVGMNADQLFSLDSATTDSVSSFSASQITGFIDSVIAARGHGIMLFHKIVASGASVSGDINLVDLQTILDHVVLRRDQGLIEPVTVKAFYDGLVHSGRLTS